MLKVVPAIFLAGPTGSGKTAVATHLARRLNGEIISCDSMQVYRAMPILTQAPPALKSGVRTHLVGFLSPSKEYSAADFRKSAEKRIAQILKRGKTPILTGGTGLYFRALLDGLFDAPPADEAFRRTLYDEHEKHGAGRLHARLSAVDAAAASKIHPNDARRLVRALEVRHLTGRTFTECKGLRAGLRESLPHHFFFLQRDRADLYARIDRRVDVMLKAGLVEEVRALKKKKLGKTASMALGLREIQGVLEGGRTLQDAVAEIKKKTRHYSKRQMTWFRHEKGVEVLPVARGESAASVAARLIRKVRGK